MEVGLLTMLFLQMVMVEMGSQRFSKKESLFANFCVSWKIRAGSPPARDSRNSSAIPVLPRCSGRHKIPSTILFRASCQIRTYVIPGVLFQIVQKKDLVVGFPGGLDRCEIYAFYDGVLLRDGLLFGETSHAPKSLPLESGYGSTYLSFAVEAGGSSVWFVEELGWWWYT